MPKKHRVQLDFAQSTFDLIKELQEKLDIPTKAGVIRNALKFYAWYVNEISEGKELLTRDKAGVIQKVIIF